ncbi:hypothetical protein [Caballeronia udeis]|uniref:hypothetical protein n=1 Tax=Caballeronia udeis TaxID=1232866 RepID=UPI0012E857AA|nr:hypothetical protein [Caballeronia udeis]
MFKSKLHAVWSNAPSGKAPDNFHALNTAFKPFSASADAPNWRVKRPLRLDRTVLAAARALLESQHRSHRALLASLSLQYENIPLRPLPASRFFREREMRILCGVAGLRP